MDGSIRGLGHDQPVSHHHLIQAIATGHVGQLQDPLACQSCRVGGEFVASRAGKAGLPDGLGGGDGRGSDRQQQEEAQMGSSVNPGNHVRGLILKDWASEAAGPDSRHSSLAHEIMVGETAKLQACRRDPRGPCRPRTSVKQRGTIADAAGLPPRFQTHPAGRSQADPTE